MKEKCIDCKYSRQCVTVKQIDPECCLKDRENEKKDEIKEIYLPNENSRFIETHDNMGCVMVNGILTKNITYEEYADIISKAKYFLLVDKDYITNLQEENKRLKDKLNIDLEWAKRCDDLFIERNNYKSRNEKAIEYIKQHQVRISIAGEKELGFCDEFDIFSNPIILLNILQGEENDN